MSPHKGHELGEVQNSIVVFICQGNDVVNYVGWDSRVNSSICKCGTQLLQRDLAIIVVVQLIGEWLFNFFFLEEIYNQETYPIKDGLPLQ